MPDRFICIHGHFYQPPRENPWLEAIEVQDSAYPYHDWNARVAAECYGPNAASRRLDQQGQITSITNNYAKISFNFGPTLLSWLEANAPDIYQAILEADRQSQRNYSGHGSALAQAYNHMILPLANSRDKYTQVLWGIRDFERRFHRQPEGMWLPETAVDVETLEVLAELGIQFTILATHQAARARRTGARQWRELSGAGIESTRAYLSRLPSGRTINLFFYDGPISRAVAFEGLLNKGEDFAHRLAGGFAAGRGWPQLVNIATDGESYGHHHRFGDMALAHALQYIEASGLARLTNYGEFLEKHPPTHEVQIRENTSWSCPHGVERWRSDCGCHSGRLGGSQAWRKPLRTALDWLRDTLAPAYQERAGELLRDPWAARDDYVDVVLDRSQSTLDRFWARHTKSTPADTDAVTALKLLELQRHAMLMYTSCGWFFDELSRIETVQIIQYAGRVVQLSRELFGRSVETPFLDLLEKAKSNLPAHRDGRWLYGSFVKPAAVDFTRVAAHVAVSSLFQEYPAASQVYSYRVDLEDYRIWGAGRAKLAVGRARVTSQVIPQSLVLSFGAMRWGGHSLNAGVRAFQREDAYQEMLEELTRPFFAGEFPEVVGAMDRHLGGSDYSLESLFKDERRKVRAQVLETALVGVEAAHRQQFESNYTSLRYLVELGDPVPPPLAAAAEFTLNHDLRLAASADAPPVTRIRSLLNDVRYFKVKLDSEALARAFQETLERAMTRFSAAPQEPDRLQAAVTAAELAVSLPFGVDLWRAQNLYYGMAQSRYPALRDRAQQEDPDARHWVAQFAALGQRLSVRLA